MVLMEDLHLNILADWKLGSFEFSTSVGEDIPSPHLLPAGSSEDTKPTQLTPETIHVRDSRFAETHRYAQSQIHTSYAGVRCLIP